MMTDDRHNSHCLRSSVCHGEHIHAKGVLKLCFFIKEVLQILGVCTAPHLDDNADAIATAKQILQTKGASYRNITFASGSEAGQFALNIMSFPTTYVIDRNGKIVGEPVLGGITNENSMKQLQENIDTAIANDGK